MVSSGDGDQVEGVQTCTVHSGMCILASWPEGHFADGMYSWRFNSDTHHSVSRISLVRLYRITFTFIDTQKMYTVHTKAPNLKRY